jgi:Leucine-rich repeat (LRR) protein
MKLTIGSIYIGVEPYDLLRLSDVEGHKYEFGLSDMLDLPGGRLGPHLDLVTEIVIGFSGVTNLDFLAYFPEAGDVWIIDSTVKDISGLQNLKKLKALAIDRPTCRMDVLGKLHSLERIFLDDWRPGADSIFQVRTITYARIRRMKEANLSRMSAWTSLKELWLHAGALTDLAGLPTTLEVLELSSIRGLTSLSSVGVATQLQKLIIGGCKNIHDLEGLQSCPQLRTLVIARSGYITSLSPLKNLQDLDYVYLGDDTVVRDDIDVLYSLHSLKKLIISGKSGLDVERFHQALPDCDLIVAKR